MSKKLLRKFDIKIQSLSNNEHKFRFEFNQELFDFFSQEKLRMWEELREEITKFNEIDYALSFDNLKEIVKNQNLERFELKPVLKKQKQDTFNIF